MAKDNIFSNYAYPYPTVSENQRAYDNWNNSITTAANMAQNINPETLAGIALGQALGTWGGWQTGNWLQNLIQRGQNKRKKPTFDTKVKYNLNGKPYSLDELQKIYGADNLSPKLNPPQNEQPADVQSVQQQFNWADNAGIPKGKQTAISFPGGKVSREDYDWYTGANWMDRNYTGTDWIDKRPQQGEPLSSYVSRMNFQDNLNNNSWENIIKREAQSHLNKFKQSADQILYPFPKDITLPTTYIPKSKEEFMDDFFGNPTKKIGRTKTYFPYNRTYNFNSN